MVVTTSPNGSRSWASTEDPTRFMVAGIGKEVGIDHFQWRPGRTLTYVALCEIYATIPASPHLTIHPSIHLPIYASTYLCIYLPFIYLSTFYLCICLSCQVDPSVYEALLSTPPLFSAALPGPKGGGIPSLRDECLLSGLVFAGLSHPLINKGLTNQSFF
jgi:hypothetical protein